MPLFPPGTPVTIQVSGRPLESYLSAYVAGGRVFVPARALLAGIADRIWRDGNTLVVERGSLRIRIPLAPGSPLDGLYVPAMPLLRELGAGVSYDGRRHVLAIRPPGPTPIATPTPFDAAAPSAPPAPVFTPSPQATPRPVWTGSPLPRRTPLFFSPPPE